MLVQLLFLLAGLSSQGAMPQIQNHQEPVLSEDSQEQVRYALGNNQLGEFSYFGGHGIAVDWLNPPRGGPIDGYPVPVSTGLHGGGHSGNTGLGSGDPGPQDPLPPDNPPTPTPPPPAVPEPATVALLAMGGVGVMLRRRRQT